MCKFIGIVGLLVMIGICWLLSTDRKKVDWKLVGFGMLLQFVIALLLLKTAWGQAVFHWLDTVAMAVISHAKAGAVFLFSNGLADSKTAEEIFGKGQGFIFAFQSLPAIIFLSALTAILFHLGIMQRIVRVLALAMRYVMRISGAEACSATANIFLGQTEAPLTIRPYMEKMTRSELHCVMVGGLATVSGSILGAYVGMLQGRIDGLAGHFLTASVMSAPAAIVFAKLLVPETGVPETFGNFKMPDVKTDRDVISACGRGCSEGLRLALNVAAMLVGFLALISMLQWLWNGGVSLCGLDERFTLQSVIGYLFSPFAFLLGIPPEEVVMAGELLGEKTITNECVAYLHFADLLDTSMANCSLHTRVVISYALCGFANLGSIGILLGGMGGMAPSRKDDIAALSFRALLGGTFASFSTAVIAGLFV